MSKSEVEIDTRKIVQGIEMKIHLKGWSWWRFRFRLTILLIRFAVWMAEMKCTIDIQPAEVNP